MKYLTRKQMQELDRKTIEEYGIPAIVLMENAGRALAAQAMQSVRHIKKPYIYVICGRGNNGGDGFVAARHLFNSGVKTNIIYTGEINFGKIHKSRSKYYISEEEKGAAGINLSTALKIGIPVKELSICKLNFKSVDLIIDAVFGIGLTRPVQGEIKELIELVNKSGKPVIAADVPSGLDCDTGKPLGVSIEATRCITFWALKAGFKNKGVEKYTGKVFVVDPAGALFLDNDSPEK